MGSGICLNQALGMGFIHWGTASSPLPVSCFMFQDSKSCFRIQNPVSGFDKNNHNNEIMNQSKTSTLEISLLICYNCYVGLLAALLTLDYSKREINKLRPM